MEAVRQDGAALQFASRELRGDREVALEAVKQNGLALESASEELRSDRAVVLEAVGQNGLALAFASDGLRGDRDVVMEALRQDAGALALASETLRLSERDKWGQHSWGHCKFVCLLTGICWGTPVNLLLSSQKCQGVPFFPNL